MHTIYKERNRTPGSFYPYARFDIEQVGYYKDWRDALLKAMRHGGVRPLAGDADPPIIGPGRYIIRSIGDAQQIVEVYEHTPPVAPEYRVRSA